MNSLLNWQKLGVLSIKVGCFINKKLGFLSIKRGQQWLLIELHCGDVDCFPIFHIYISNQYWNCITPHNLCVNHSCKYYITEWMNQTDACVLFCEKIGPLAHDFVFMWLSLYYNRTLNSVQFIFIAAACKWYIIESNSNHSIANISITLKSI